VASATAQKAHGIRALDVAKRLLDYGVHPPTIYFPLIVDEALMFEPTETESREDLDRIIDVLRTIAAEAASKPDVLHEAPTTMPVRRLDEVEAARRPVLRQEFVAESELVARSTP
jgi:glycine dehydrogenase subunit 2